MNSNLIKIFFGGLLVIALFRLFTGNIILTVPLTIIYLSSFIISSIVVHPLIKKFFYKEERPVQAQSNTRLSLGFVFLLFFSGIMCVLYVQNSLLFTHPIFTQLWIPIIFYLVCFSFSVWFALKFKINSWVVSTGSVMSLLIFVFFTLMALWGFISKHEYVGECQSKNIYVRYGLGNLGSNSIFKAEITGLKIIGTISVSNEFRSWSIMNNKFALKDEIPPEISSCQEVVDKILETDYSDKF